MSAHSKGSARVPRASSGVAPELASPHLPGIMGGEKLVEPGFRRDAENHTPEARAPRNPRVRPMSVSQFGSKCRGLVVLLLALVLGATGARAVDFHVATAQDLQNALTLAAANGANNNIYVTNGYYIGNFNYNSAAGYNLAVTNEPGVTNTQITLDGAGGGRALSLTSSGTGSITVAGLTFLRNCGSTAIGALRIAAGGGGTILVNGCQFLSPTNTSGMGLEIASGLNATVTNCTAIGASEADNYHDGTGISISGVTGNTTVQNCILTTNKACGLVVSSTGIITIAANIFTSNSNGGGGGSGGGASCNGQTIILTSNTFIGNSGMSGGVYCSYITAGSMTVTFTGNTFTGNSGGSGGSGGGGAFCNGYYSMAVTLVGNTFTGNSSTYYYSAGGFSCNAYEAYANGIILTATGNTFTGNSGSGAGGIFTPLCSATLTGNTFTGNSGGNGGGVSCSGLALFTNNSFIGNSASASGGGVYCSSGTLVTFSANTFNLNSAATGGGIYALSQTNNLLDNLFARNTAASQGGGIWVNASSTLFLINNTITANTSSGTGGGIAFQVSGVVELLNVYNNIIWGNTATGSGGDVYLTGTGQKKVFDFNDVDSMYGVWDIAVNNKDVSPQFFDPVNGDYHIQSTSPCKDAGTNGAPSLPATDLDGGPRIANGTVDLGCYEFSTAATHPADTNGDFVITPAEYAAYAVAWKAGQTWSNAPTVIPANYVTRAGYLMTNGGTYHNDGSARPVNWKVGP